ncbi:hypothetical protein [Candidatus Synechococcus spongiarum]|uniref:Uncharacterized protein n=1 Tax=Candidatus Synechococcus spongiarum TaxID=431041 RepID=A0A170TF78_9SYNE|nr:hypothetical protein [Candidatus Synechococcus spongiarum]CZB22309.1 hypothetical protein FLM9_1504 [Candidatus Synechococcus spongiarum]
MRADFKAEIKDIKVEMKQDNGEIKVEVRGMGKKLDRVLEILLAAQS